jgi:hypothetical protein
MKKTFPLFCALLATLSLRADVLFQDATNYPYTNGCIEGQGQWYCYSPSAPNLDAFVTNNLLILTAGNQDAVAVPTNGLSNPGAPNVVYASFTINVSKLPSATGGYFCEFMDATNNSVAHLFIDTQGTSVPGTYRLGLANYATSINSVGAKNFPMDLATNITYQVVMSWDETTAALQGTLWVNPSPASGSTLDPNYVYGGDTTNGYLLTMPVSTIGFSQYGGVEAIGNVRIATAFNDAMTNVAQLPVMGIQPQGSTNYLGNSTTLYTAASGMEVTYQWYSNNVPLVDDGVTVVGSTSQVLNLSNLQATATYYVVATDAAGSTTSSNAVVGVNTAPTLPFFTLQPQGGTNSVLSAVTLSATADGTGPITYQWYFEPAGSSTFGAVSGQTSSTYTFSAAYVNSGAYYVTATGGAGSANSATVNVLVIPPPLFSIGYMHNYISNLNANASINGGQIFNVQGVVTSIGQIESKTTAEFFIQDGTGACLVYAGGFTPTNAPPVGALVNVVSPAESYYGELEMDPTTTAASNAVIILSTNNALPAPVPLNIGQVCTNSCSLAGTYGWSNQCALVTLTNVYLYSSTAGAAVSGNFPTNGTKALYAFQQPYVSGLSKIQQPYVEIFVYTYTNAANLQNTNYFGQPIPGFAYELTGALGVYAPTTPNIYPSRYQDFVTTPPPAFSASVKSTNGFPALTWSAVTGSTYSVYSATNLLGPWTQTFGLGYYPSMGAYTDTNAATAKFYRVSTP